MATSIDATESMWYYLIDYVPADRRFEAIRTRIGLAG
jgi:hypothetical protein